MDITGNHAQGYGGALHFFGGTTCTITGGIIDGNVAPKGAGMFIDTIAGMLNIDITGTVITGNVASTAGGGVYNYTPANAAVVFHHTDIGGNFAPTYPNLAGTGITFV